MFRVVCLIMFFPFLRMSSAKKLKYSVKFNSAWLMHPSYKSWLMEVDTYTVKCKFCLSQLTIQHEGEGALKNHLKSERHRKLTEARNGSAIMTNHLIKSSQADTVTIAEISLVYHNVNHMLSYSSLDCGSKISSQVFKDSATANLITLGKTKASAIAQCVLGPHALKLPLEDLILPDGSCRPFSISSDASNKGKINNTDKNCSYI